MKLLALALAGGITTHATLLGGSSDKCMWGPSYWCTSISEAKECAASRFCLTKQWTQPVSDDNQMCKLCKQVIDSVIDQVESHEDDYKPVIEQMCDYCSTAEKCRDAIEQHWADIKDMINNNLKSDVVCSALNMCQQVDEVPNSYQFTVNTAFTGSLTGPLLTPRKVFEDDSDSHIRFTPEKQSSQLVKTSQSCSKTCQDCVNFAVDAKSMMQSPKRLDQLIKTIHLLCAELPMSSLCRLVLNKKVVLEIINKVKVTEVCQNTDICVEGDSPVIKPATELVPCDDCHDLINDIKTISEDDAKHFEFIIRQSCDLIPHPVNDMCKQMASQFAKEAMNSLQLVDIDEACHDISYCGTELELPAPKFELSTDYCDYCQTAVQYIEYAIDSDMTSDEIKVGLKKLCEKIGEQSMVQTCEQFVDKYYDTIVADIDNYLDDPQSFCRSLHLCPRGGITAEELVGPVPDECTFGPAYWCKNEENMKKCKAEDYCKKKSNLLGSTDCTFGPSYWCASAENAVKCGATEYCQKTTWKQKPVN